MISIKLMLTVLAVVLSTVALSAEMDHSQHDSGDAARSAYHDKQGGDALRPLKTMPESGKGREAAFDDRYGMEPTSANESLADLCAKGSRGLIMLDRQTWEKCGGAPEGWPQEHDGKTPKATSEHQH